MSVIRHQKIVKRLLNTNADCTYLPFNHPRTRTNPVPVLYLPSTHVNTTVLY